MSNEENMNKYIIRCTILLALLQSFCTGLIINNIKSNSDNIISSIKICPYVGSKRNCGPDDSC